MPSFKSRILFVLALLVVIFDVGFFAFSIKIFAEKIENSVDAFVGVVLPTTLELLGVFAEDTLEHVRSDHTRIHIPHFIHCFRISQNKTAISAQSVFLYLFTYKFEVSVEEEFG